MKMTDIRIGHGYDVHAFQEGDHLMLGGVRVPHDRAFKAHSDGDVLIHALCDALLGAAALGDIGRHFPDTDPRYAGADSRALLREVRQLLEEGGWLVGNVDCTVIAQAPRLAPHVESMREHLAADLAVDVSRVNVKATTTERLGFAGREEGVAAHAVVLIERA
jgi:2-C-methyl-D-erythritol 2,4-cyclodiphosphate synthase